MSDYECIGTIDAHISCIRSLNVLEYAGKKCLVNASWDQTIKILDIDSRSVITTLQSDSNISVMTVFMNGDKACLATDKNDGSVKLWME